ncbi:MAG TPA: hypothetical protein VGI78_13990, partial [Acetobacteraceae bacterium]
AFEQELTNGNKQRQAPAPDGQYLNGMAGTVTDLFIEAGVRRIYAIVGELIDRAKTNLWR